MFIPNVKILKGGVGNGPWGCFNHVYKLEQIVTILYIFTHYMCVCIYTYIYIYTFIYSNLPYEETEFDLNQLNNEISQW